MRNRVWILCVLVIVLAASGGILPAQANLPLPARFSPALQRLVRQLAGRGAAGGDRPSERSG